MLNIDQSRESGFRRLLQSGGANVLPSPTPSLYNEATHLFADFSRLKPGDFRVDVSEATSQGVTCLKPEYIADYLMQVSGALCVDYCDCVGPNQRLEFSQSSFPPGADSTCSALPPD